jgi:hypothetical protein
MFFTCHSTFKRYFVENGLFSSQCFSFWNAALLATRIALMLAMISGMISSTFNERPDVPAIFIGTDLCGLLATVYWWCHDFNINISKTVFILKILVAVFIVETLLVAIAMFFVVSPEGPVSVPFFVISILSTVLNGLFVLFVGCHIYYVGRVDCFISHAWASDLLDRRNHYRVLRIAEELQKYGIITWFDEDDLGLGHDIKQKLAQGIQRSSVFIAFLTTAYQNKVVSTNLQDSCFFELNHARTCFPKKIIIGSVMEPSMLKAGDWHAALDPLGPGALNSDFSFDFNYKGDPLVLPVVPDEIRYDSNETLLKQRCYDLARSVIELSRLHYNDIV